jgi:hypothetical protein
MSGNIRRLKMTVKYFISNEMAVHFYVFGSFVEDGILCNVKCKLTITEELHRHRMRNTQAAKNALYPL